MKTVYRILLVLLVFTGLLFRPLLTTAQQTNHSYNDMANEILRLINEHRAGMGLDPLKTNTLITQASEKHSRNMATKKIPFGHGGFDQRMANLRKQLRPVNGWAENVAGGSRSAKEVVDLWLSSPGHKKNIEGAYNLTGIGIAKGSGGGPFFTEIFVNKEK